RSLRASTSSGRARGVGRCTAALLSRCREAQTKRTWPAASDRLAARRFGLRVGAVLLAAPAQQSRCPRTGRVRVILHGSSTLLCHGRGCFRSARPFVFASSIRTGLGSPLPSAVRVPRSTEASHAAQESTVG